MNGDLDILREELGKNIKLLKSNLRVKSSESKILSNIQEYPCSVKCVYEINNPSYKNIDSLYSAKHEYIRNKIIEAIIDRYGNQLLVYSEYFTKTGKLDIALFQSNQTRFKHAKKIIGIEIKSGKRTDVSHFYQIERYILSCDLLILIRVPYEQVISIDIGEELKQGIKNSVASLNKKTLRMLNGDLIKVQGDWCKGCNCICDYRKPPLGWYNNNLSNMESPNDLIKNIDLVITKLIKILEFYIIE